MRCSISCLLFLTLATAGRAEGKSDVEARFATAVKQAIEVAVARKFTRVLVVSRVAIQGDSKHEGLEPLSVLLKHRVYHAFREGKLEARVSQDADALVAELGSTAILANRDIQRLKSLSGADAVLVVDVLERGTRRSLKIVLDEGRREVRDWQRTIRLPTIPATRPATTGWKPVDCAPGGG